MRPLEVEFAPRRPWTIWLCAAVAFIALAWAGVQSVRWWQLDQQLQALRARDLATQALIEANRHAASHPEPKAEPAYAESARQALALASFDMGAVLAALESAQIAGVHVSSMELSADTRTARVELELQSAELVTPYVEALNAGDPQPHWSLAALSNTAASGAAAATVVGSWPQRPRHVQRQ